MLNLGIFILLTQGALGVKFFNSTDQLPDGMPTECKDALTADISCSPHLFSPVEVTRSLDTNTTDLDQYCSTGCTDSLQVSNLKNFSETSSDQNTIRIGRTKCIKAAAMTVMTSDIMSCWEGRPSCKLPETWQTR